ncbi:MAG: hypothetical protein WD267_09615 [Balneolales bacterium]
MESKKSFTNINNVRNITTAESPSQRPAGSIVAWGAEGAALDEVPLGDNFVELAIPGDGGINYALRSDGTIAAWGKPTHSTVADIPDGDHYTAIATDGNQLIALREDGTIFPDNPLSEGDNFVAVSAVPGMNIALKDDGTVVTWGSADAVFLAPKENHFTNISAGGAFGLALETDGSLMAWGLDEYDQVGGAPTEGKFKSIAAGNYHSLALGVDGSIEQWGVISDGKPTDAGYVDIAASWHNLALRQDGTLVGWGDDFGGQVSDTPEGGRFVEPAVGLANSFAIKVKE